MNMLMTYVVGGVNLYIDIEAMAVKIKNSAWLMGTACLFLTVTSGVQAAPPVTVNVPVDSAYYSYIDKLSAMGYLKTMPNGARPYSRLQLARWVKEAQETAKSRPMPAYLADETEAMARYVAPELAVLDGSKLEDPVRLRDVSVQAGILHSDEQTYRYGQGIRAGWQPFSHKQNGYTYGRDGNGILSADISGNIDQNLALSVRPRISYDRDNKGSVTLEEGYIKQKMGVWNLEIGREALRWGQGETGNLALGSNMRPLTTVQVHYNEPRKTGGFFRFLGERDFHIFYGRLEGSRADEAAAAGRTDYDHAGILGIRTDFSPTSYFTFGLARISVLGGDHNGLDWSDWKHWTYGRNDDNSDDRWDDIAGGDFRLRLPKMTLYGELYGEDQSHYLPSDIAWRAGLYLPALTRDGSWDMTLEMAHTTDSWYSHQHFQNGWTYHDAIMGDDMGRNARKYYAAVRHYLPKESRIGLYAMRTERDRDTMRSQSVNEWGLTGQKKLRDHMYLRGTAGYASVSQPGGHSDHDAFALVSLQWQYQ